MLVLDYFSPTLTQSHTVLSALRASLIVKMTAAHQTGRGAMMCRRSLRQEEPAAGEPGKAPSATGLTAAAGHAASQQLSGRSNYAVPSQINEVDGVIDLTAEQVEGSKMPAASDGHHVEGCEYDSESVSLCAKN